MQLRKPRLIPTGPRMKVNASKELGLSCLQKLQNGGVLGQLRVFSALKVWPELENLLYRERQLQIFIARVSLQQAFSLREVLVTKEMRDDFFQQSRGN